MPIVVLMCKDLIFCQFFFSSETRKLIPVVVGVKRCGLATHRASIKIVDETEHDICEDLVIGHLDVTDGDAEA